MLPNRKLFSEFRLRPILLFDSTVIVPLLSTTNLIFRCRVPILRFFLAHFGDLYWGRQQSSISSAMERDEVLIPVCHDVVMIGTGVSGLMAARVLLHQGHSVNVLEARIRKAGRAFSYSFQKEGCNNFVQFVNDRAAEDSNPIMRADLGCSSIHGVQHEGNSLWNLDVHHSIMVSAVLDGIALPTTNYENTFTAALFHNGKRVSQYEASLMHRVHDAIITRIAGCVQRRAKGVFDDNLIDIYKRYQEEILETFKTKLTNDRENILVKIRNRNHGYCAPL